MLNANQRVFCIMPMGNGARQHHENDGRLHSWFVQNESRLIAADIVCLTLLFFAYLLASTLQVLPDQLLTIIQIATIALISFIVLSVIWKGIVPVIICVLGVVLIYHAIILAGDARPEEDGFIGNTRFSWSSYAPEAVLFARLLQFFIGIGTVALSIIIAYRPSLLYARNRPASLEAEWSKYPIWYDNTLLADGRTEPSVPVKSMMTDQDRYLLWRYEYLLASIYGSPHLVQPYAMVPKDSTSLFRDKASGRIIGKPRYTGYFV